MNAHALLSSQGWRGTGHSLHKHDDSIGLAKPLLLSRKDNTKGLGTSQHFNNDQWWMNAFDEQLKGLETNDKGHIVQTLTTGKLNTFEKGAVGKYSVYTSFVKGGFLEGTLDLLNKQLSSSKPDDIENKGQPVSQPSATPKDVKESKEERRARKEARRKRKEERAKSRAEKAARRERKTLKAKGIIKAKSNDAAKEDKKQRRARKEERRRRRELEGKSKKSTKK